jgi:hypothetical protein
MRAFQIIDLPVPERLGPGQYEPWLERCRKEVVARSMTADAGDAKHSILDVVVPRGIPVNLLHLLTWVDRLVRDLKVVPEQYNFSEYGTAFSPDRVRSKDGRDVKVTIYLDIDIVADVAQSSNESAPATPETAAA